MTSLPRHEIVIGLGFGDEGKGAVVDALAADPAREPVGTVVRFNGGAQAAHNVVLPDGRHHTFAQFGSATLRGASTHLSRFMLVEPFALAAEGEALAALGVPAPLRRLTIDRRALLTTPWHAAANRAKEIARGDARHGSCGSRDRGDDGVRRREPGPRSPCRRCDRSRADSDAGSRPSAMPSAPGIVAAGLVVPALEPVAEAFEAFGAAVRLVGDDFLAGVLRRERVVFEGAQGVLLDEWRAFHPYATWSTTTFANAHALLAEAGVAAGEARRVGVLRVYTTRHGAGPLPAEDDALTAALPEAHNGTGAWQGGFRAGHLDLVLHRYALRGRGWGGSPGPDPPRPGRDAGPRGGGRLPGGRRRARPAHRPRSVRRSRFPAGADRPGDGDDAPRDASGRDMAGDR